MDDSNGVDPEDACSKTSKESERLRYPHKDPFLSRSDKPQPQFTQPSRVWSHEGDDLISDKSITRESITHGRVKSPHHFDNPREPVRDFRHFQAPSYADYGGNDYVGNVHNSYHDGLSGCDGGWTYDVCYEKKYVSSSLGELEFNRTLEMTPFSFESFEGPSLIGGLDNRWVGREFSHHNGKATLDPYSDENHAIHFPSYSVHGDFFSEPIQNADVNDNPYLVKFKYLSTEESSGGCIGYVDTIVTTLRSYAWVLCDGSMIDGNMMESNGEWISCQFKVPQSVGSFRNRNRRYQFTWRQCVL